MFRTVEVPREDHQAVAVAVTYVEKRLFVSEVTRPYEDKQAIVVATVSREKKSSRRSR